LEDTLEQIFGDIGDEHDLKRPPVHQESTKLEVEGSTTIRDLETRYHIVLPADAGFETLAGFLLMQFGYIPQAGQSLEHAGRRFTITEMEKNRIAKVQIERLEPKQAMEEATL
jgi:CBS domain containing-hemolysin-like protein